MIKRLNKNTKTTKPMLLLPVENQVRELDAKILLACIAARRGLDTVLGPRHQLEFRVNSFPRSIYVSKSLKSGNGRYFKILRKLGHEIAAWDEEALVHLPADTYFSRRFSLEAVKHVSYLLAWGRDNADLWRQHPELTDDTMICITGNPRGDLLRPEIRLFYEKEVQRLRKRYGNFILVNTNFSNVNAFYPIQRLFQPVKRPGEKPKLGNAAEGMTFEYARGLWDHRRLIFDDFKHLIPKLEKAFPEYGIIVRPHPGENQEVYHRIADQCERVLVTNEGNVVPWIMAAEAMIHNGCTTGVEAYLLGTPPVSYRASVDEYYDYEYHRLPNMLSYECFDFEELRQTLTDIFAGEHRPDNGDNRKSIMDHHLASQRESLACESIVDILCEISQSVLESPKPPLSDQLKGRYMIIRRRLVKKYRSLLQKTHKTPELARHNYPGISIEQMRARVSRFQQVLGYENELKVDQVYNQIYQVSS